MRVEGEVRLVRLETAITRAASYRAFVPLVDGLLVDSGFAHARRQLLAALSGEKVEQLVHTHAHEDHFGNDAAVTEAFGATVHAPAGSLAALAAPTAICPNRYQRVVWGVPSPSRAEALGAEVSTRRFRFQVVPTPGHSADHVALLEPERGWLFAGDLFLSPRVKVARGFENGNDLIASLERVLALRPRLLFCYHRGLVEDARGALEAKRRFLAELRDRTLALAAEGCPPSVIARRLLGREPWGYRLLTDFSKEKLVASFLKAPGMGYGG